MVHLIEYHAAIQIFTKCFLLGNCLGNSEIKMQNTVGFQLDEKYIDDKY